LRPGAASTAAATAGAGDLVISEVTIIDVPEALGVGWWQWRTRVKRDPCVWCARRPAKRSRSIEHITPRSKGGADDPSNIVGACASDNSARSAETLLFFLLDRLD
jgi:hypothetical protein